MSESGRIELIIGCMWSGKSSEMLRQAKRYKSIGKNILVINHNSDTRYGENVVSTHDQNQLNCLSLTNLGHIRNTIEYKNCEIILIDEGQFFNDLYEFCVLASDIDNKTIIISGLDGDSNRKPFGDILKLIPLSEKITKLNALCQYCKDGTIASFTLRKTNNQETTLVGNENIYSAVCRKHYNELNNNLDTNNMHYK